MKIFLPAPDLLMRKSKSLAALDSMICQDWEFRYFSHNSKWSENQEMGSMRNGEGDDYFVLFSQVGVAVKGCFIDGGYSGDANLIREIKEKFPKILDGFVHEPAFSIEESSFVIWFDERHREWVKIGINTAQGSDLDGSGYLMGWLAGGAHFYKKWADVYYEESIDISLVEHVFDFLPIDE